MGVRRSGATRVAAIGTTAALVLGALGCSNDEDRALGGAGGGGGGGAPIASPDLTLAVALESFDSCDDLLDHLRSEALARVSAYGLEGADPWGGDLPMTGPAGGRFEDVGVAIDFSGERSAAPAPSTTAPGANELAPYGPDGSGGDTPFSTTNVQEVGVDEPDLVKTDGRRLFVLLDNTLRAFTVDGDTPNEVGTLELDLDGGEARNLLLAGNDVLVLGEVYGGDLPRPLWRGPGVDAASSYYGAGGATLTKVDVTDPTAMSVSSSVTVDGRYLNARMVGDTARVVLASPPPAFDFVYPSRPGSPRAEQVAKEANEAMINEAELEDWLPNYVTDANDEASPLLDCDSVSHPKEFSGFGTLTVFTVPMDVDLDPANAIGVLASGDQVYASPERLYVSTTRWPEPGAPRSGSVEAPAEEPGTEPGPEPGEESTSPGTEPAPGTTQPPVEPTRTRTAVHRFAIPADGPAVYEASGEVPGRLLHEFSMSEHDGNLRVASTQEPDWSARRPGVSESYVTVLGERDGRLDQMGQVGELGKTEEIRAVRFMGDIGYVVTFRQTDPLYTIDLSDPTDPKVAGELKILGYSAYLHPVAEGRLLGVGQDATEQGFTIGTQVALYDVSDPANPTEMQKVTLPASDSAVEHDYHAFLWWDPTSLAMIPVQSYGGCAFDPTGTRNCIPTTPLVGAIGYTVTPEGISELAKVAQPGPGLAKVRCERGEECAFPATATPEQTTATTVARPGEAVCFDEFDCWPGPVSPPYPGMGSPILRSIVIGDSVLTVSRTGIRSSALDTLAPLSWVPFG